ncbi:metallophosphoesterase [Kytococcus sp. Marseille-QA3725]
MKRTLSLVSLAALTTLATPAWAGEPPTEDVARVAVLGDTPYGPEQTEQFPALVDDVNGTDSWDWVFHAGDVKSGSTPCSDELLARSRALYDTFEAPFVLTPGDNEWTDCHREKAGRYIPTERLEHARGLFYPNPSGTIGGRSMEVTPQSAEQPDHAQSVENVRFHAAGTTFATVHVVGSENGEAPWDELAEGDRPAERMAEVRERRAANLDWIDAAFDAAEERGDEAVAIMMQAEPVADVPGFAAERALLLERATAFDGPVLLLHGDEHQYENEPAYGGVENLTRVETFGDTATDWLSMTVDPSTEEVFFFETHRVGREGPIVDTGATTGEGHDGAAGAAALGLLAAGGVVLVRARRA